MKNKTVRRDFIKQASLYAAGTVGFSMFSNLSHATPVAFVADNKNIIGPIEGYSPQVGTIISMLSWMRDVILSPVKNMTMEQLDYIHDKNANSIGSMLLHLAATERFYQIHTFDGKKWGDWGNADKKRFGVAMGLGDKGREEIKGNNLDFYLDTLNEVRDRTLTEFKKRDDAWLMQVDEKWPWGPTNNYCKWFHVCEHESNHNGQIKWIKGRLPGSKAGND
jgi:uncharacterized damage-inducible protein DinB